jgi:hypothetical protein
VATTRAEAADAAAEAAKATANAAAATSEVQAELDGKSVLLAIALTDASEATACK